MRRASTGTKQKWTVEEEVALREGVKRYGPGKWRQIQKDPELQAMLRNRTNVDLKDKWRNISMDNAPRRGGASTAANSGNKRRRRTPAERPRRMSDDSEEDVEVGVEEDSPRVRRQQPRRGVRQQSFLPEEAESDEASRKEEEEQDLLPTGYSNGSSRSCTPTSLESDGQSGRSEWGSAAYNTEDNVLPFEAYKITEAAMMILYGHGQGSGLQEITDWIKAALHFADGDSIDMSYIGEILEDMVKQGRATCSNGMYHPTGPLRELVDSAVKMAAFIDTAPDAPQTPPKPSPSSSDGQGSVVRDTSDGSSSATNGSEQNLAINQRDPSQINVDVLMETIDMIREAENDAYSRARATWIRENFGTFVREQYDQGHLPAENRWAAYLDGPLDKGLLPAGEG